MRDRTMLRACRGGPRFAFWISCCSGLLTLPGAAFAADDAVRARSTPVLGGEASARSGVVYLATNLDDDPETENRLCSGSVISSKLVLTARHCVSSFTDGTFSCTIQGNIDKGSPIVPPSAGSVGFPYDPELIRVFADPNGPVRVDKTSADALRVRRVFTLETSDICRNDIALLELEAPIAVEPLAVRLDSGIRPGDRLNIVGYGRNDDGDSAQHESDDVRVIGVGVSDFFPLEGQAPPRTFSVGFGPCPGDSGGPALAAATDAIVGVFSFFKGNCDSTTVYNYYTQLAPFSDFVRSTLETVGQSPRLEGQTAMGGSDSSQGGAGAPSIQGGLGGTAGADGGGRAGSIDDLGTPGGGCSLASGGLGGLAGGSLGVMVLAARGLRGARKMGRRRDGR